MKSLSGAVSLLAAGVQFAGVAVADAIETVHNGPSHSWSMGLSAAMVGGLVCAVIGAVLLLSGNASPPESDRR